MAGGRSSLKRHPEVGGLICLPLLLFGLGIVQVVDLQGHWVRLMGFQR